MNKFYFSFFILLITTKVLKAQFTPIPSPGASTNQTVGITFLNIEYSRPGVKNRKIFGDLVPYNKVWRTGANAATIFETSNDILINGSVLKAGLYSLLTIPNPNEWTIIFNRDLEVTEESYFSINDELRVFSKPETNEFTETFTLDFSDIKDNSAKLNLKWDKTKISLNINVDNLVAIKQAIDNKTIEAAGAFQQSAEYLLNNNLDINLAEEYVNRSISLSPSFRNHWIKGRIYLLKKENQKALEQFLIAQELGANDPVFDVFKATIEGQIKELKK